MDSNHDHNHYRAWNGLYRTRHVPRCTDRRVFQQQNYAKIDHYVSNCRTMLAANFAHGFVPIVVQSTMPTVSVLTIKSLCSENKMRAFNEEEYIFIFKREKKPTPSELYIVTVLPYTELRCVWQKFTYGLIFKPFVYVSGSVKLIWINPNCMSAWSRLLRFRNVPTSISLKPSLFIRVKTTRQEHLN